MLKITSTANERIKFLKTLKTKKGREKSGTYLLEGKRAVTDAMMHGVKFEWILAEQPENFPFLQTAESDRIIQVSRQIIEVLSDTLSPEGILAQVRMHDTSFDKNKLSGLVVFLDQLQDAGNLGTIIRTADAAGAGAVVLSPHCVEVFNPKTIRATMSSIFNIPIMCAADSIQALEAIKQKGYTVYAAALGGENVYTLEKKSPAQESCIIIGNEGNGITESVLACADQKIALPIRGGAESLNAGIAAGILIYHFTFEGDKTCQDIQNGRI